MPDACSLAVPARGGSGTVAALFQYREAHLSPAPAQPLPINMERSALLLLALVACCGLGSAVHLEFSSGLDGWTHSSDDKYNGVFEVATPEGLTSQALKVRSIEPDR